MTKNQHTSHKDIQEKDVQCPNCGHRQKLTVACVLYPDTTALQELFSGKLNLFTCPECDKEFSVDTALTFSDHENAGLVHFENLDGQQQRREAREQLGVLIKEMLGENAGDDMPDYRITFNRNRFIEKIALHMRDLDDRLIEYVKYQIYNRPDGQLDAVRHELLFDFSQTDNEKLTFLIFDRETGNAQSGIYIPMDVYEELKDNLLADDNMNLELENLFEDCYVTVDTLLGLTERNDA